MINKEKFEKFVDENLTHGQRNSKMLEAVKEAKKLGIDYYDAKSFIRNKFNNSEWNSVEKDFDGIWNKKLKDFVSS